MADRDACTDLAEKKPAALGSCNSAVVAPMPPTLGRLALEVKQTSMRFIHKYQPSASQRRDSTAQDSHKAMVQRFQLRRVSSDVNVPAICGDPTRRRTSLLDANPLHFLQQESETSSSFLRRSHATARSWYRAATTRLRQPIAPDGRLQQARELALVLAFALQIIYFPFVAAFVTDKRTYSPTPLHVAFECVFVVDLLLAFNTAFYSMGGSAQLVVSRVAIARRYLRSWFFVDLLAAIPFHSIEILMCKIDAAGQDAHGAFMVVLLTRLPKLVHQLNLAPILVAARAFRATRQFGMWLQYSRYSHLLRILKLVVGVLTTAHYMACSWELLRTRSIASDGQPDEQEVSLFVAYVNNFYYSMLLLQGEAATPDTTTTGQNAYNIVCVMLGSLVLAVVFGNVAMLVANFYSNSTSYQRKMERVFNTMNKMELPQELRDRIHQYYEHLWLEYECLDGDIVQFAKRLTYSLEVEVGLFKYMDLVENVPFWKECSPDFITQLVLSLDVRVYLPDDYIIRKGETGEQLFMINKGTCELVQIVKSRPSSTESVGVGGGAVSSGGGRGTGDFGAGVLGTGSGTHKTSSASSFQGANVSDSEDEIADGDGDDGDEEEQTFYRFRQGESFGELALLMNYRRTMSVRAVGYVEMCILSRGRFQNVLFKYPDDRKKVLVAMLKQCIKSNLLKEIPYPWKELITSSARPATSPSRYRRDNTPPLMKALGGASERKFSCSNRRVTMFGGNWTVNDVAAALATKIDVEHTDESIVFGFQAADLKPKIAAAAAVAADAPTPRQTGDPPTPLQHQRYEARVPGTDLNRTLASFGSTPFSFATLTPASEPFSTPIGSGRWQATTRAPDSQAESEATATEVPPPQSSTAVAAALAEPDEPGDDPRLSPEHFEVAEDASRRNHHRRRSSAGIDEVQQQQHKLLVESLLAQMESAKSRLGDSESAHAQIRESLSSLTASLMQLDAVSGGAASEAQRHEASTALDPSPSQSSVTSGISSASYRLHRRSMAGHERHDETGAAPRDDARRSCDCTGGAGPNPEPDAARSHDVRSVPSTTCSSV